MTKQTENTEQTNLSHASRTIAPPADAARSDLERLEAENEQLKTTIRLAQAHRQITGELALAGARSPELLFESVKADLQFDDENNVVNAAALIEKLTSGFPEQFGTESPTVSIDGGTQGTPPPQLTKEALAKMKTEEIAALDWADVRRVLAGG